MCVDGKAFRHVDLVGDDALEVAGHSAAFQSAIEYDAAVAFVGYQQVELTIEADAPRLVQVAVSFAALTKLPDKVSIAFINVDAVAISVRNIPQSMFIDTKVDRTEQGTLLWWPELTNALARP